MMMGEFTGARPPRGGTPEEARIKGVALSNVVQGLRLREEKARAMLPEDLRHYLEDTILVSRWYPEADHVILSGVLAELIAVPGKDVWEWFGRGTAKIDLNGIYSTVIQAGQPISTLRRFPDLWELYRSVGASRVIVRGPQEVRLELSDYPFVSSEFARVVKGYVREALQMSGAEGVAVDILADGTGGQAASWRAVWEDTPN